MLSAKSRVTLPSSIPFTSMRNSRGPSAQTPGNTMLDCTIPRHRPSCWHYLPSFQQVRWDHLLEFFTAPSCASFFNSRLLDTRLNTFRLDPIMSGQVIHIARKPGAIFSARRMTVKQPLPLKRVGHRLDCSPQNDQAAALSWRFQTLLQWLEFLWLGCSCQ